jgi:hypothetical protein
MYELSSNSNGTKSQKPKANERTTHEDLSCKMKKTKNMELPKMKSLTTTNYEITKLIS